MNITRFEPLSLFNVLQRDLDQLAGRRLPASAADDNGHSVADWVPAVDVIEENDQFVLRADVPGVEPENIDVSMEKGVLTVSGHREDVTTADLDGVKRIERLNGKFFRRFSLPESANAENITARTTNGILEVAIPKQPEVKARRITVESA